MAIEIIHDHSHFTVRSTDPAYNSPLIGNGEIVTTVGPTGYHNGYCPEEEVDNRTIFWAGRRFKDSRGVKLKIPRVPPEEPIGATYPLIRFGRLTRHLEALGKRTTDDKWVQQLDPLRGEVISTLDHDVIEEQTRSLVSLTNNLLIFRTKLKNNGEDALPLIFILEYEFGDAKGYRKDGSYLHIRRPHPEDLAFGNVEGVRSHDQEIASRPPHLLESLKVQYEVDGHMGEVHIGRYPVGRIVQSDIGGQFVHEIVLAGGEAQELWFWVVLSDRLKYTHFPDIDRMKLFVVDHQQAWGKFWEKSQVEFGEPKLESLRVCSLYTLRCNASPWTIPAGYLSTTWEGRSLHDEYFPFMGLISGNHRDLAECITRNRLRTLPEAKGRSAGHGAYFGWEVTEDGVESAPYGHWTDERFIHGEIAEQVWQLYLHSGDRSDLERYYPLLRECARWLVHDVLVRDPEGQLGTRLLTDANEVVYPVENGIVVLCATIRTLENAANAANILGLDAALGKKWRELASELRGILPLDESGQVYAYSMNSNVSVSQHHLPMIFPYTTDIHGERPRATMTRLVERIENGEFKLNWLWTISRIATMLFYQLRGDEGYKVLHEATNSVGPFLAPNEHLADGIAYLPWLTTGAGAYLHAVHSIFVQVDDAGTILLPAIPAHMMNAKFKWLAGSNGVKLACKVNEGLLTRLTVHSRKALSWSFRLQERFIDGIHFKRSVVSLGADEHGFTRFECDLDVGLNEIV
ncbi:MAG: hypothetical protein GTO18_10240 [Anaerolineales bacterium]|nr:hypothetical protein [Anaerolineales bacterium]